MLAKFTAGSLVARRFSGGADLCSLPRGIRFPRRGPVTAAEPSGRSENRVRLGSGFRTRRAPQPIRSGSGYVADSPRANRGAPFGAEPRPSTSSAQGPALSRCPRPARLNCRVSYLYRRMLVEACDLEATHDRRTWIDENQRSIPPGSRQAKQGMQARAVHEDELGQFELQLVARWKRTDCFRE